MGYQIKKFLFVHIPKNAGTYIIKNIKGNKRFRGGLFEGQHRPMWRLDELCKEQGINISHLYSFAMVRNPWDRMSSIYRYATKMQKRKVFPEFFSGHKVRDNDFNNWLRWIYSDKFDRSTLLGETNLFDYWFTNQCNYFKTKDRKAQYRMDNILKMEDIDTKIEPFFNNVLGITRISDPKKPINHSGGRDHYSHYYNQESIDLVAKYFNEDIEMFDYEYIIK